MEPELQSVLFRSPYSGCQCFSGWPLDPGQKVPAQSTWPSPYNAPGALLAVDRYHKVVQAPKTPLKPSKAPPRATVTLATPAYRLRPIAGPSAAGPWTYRDTSGLYPIWRPGGIGTGQSLGLT